MKKIYFLLLALGFFTGVNAQIINFTDPDFKTILLYPSNSNHFAADINGSYVQIDANHNGEIEISEASVVYKIVISAGGTNNISSLEGISYFTNLRELIYNDNYALISNLSLQGMNNLKKISFEQNNITSLDLSNCASLETITLGYGGSNHISNLNINGCYNLKAFFLREPVLGLDLQNFSHLESFQNVDYNLQSLNVDGCISLKDLRIWGTLPILDVSDCINMEYLQTWGGQFTSLDLGNLSKLKTLNCFSNNNLTALNMKNGIVEESFNFSSCPNLKFVCTDDSQINLVQYWVNQWSSDYGNTPCTVNSYCSFVPGGTSYTIQGNNKWDTDNNGCDATDLFLPNLKFNISGVSGTGVSISDGSGNYSIPLIAGTHTITPAFENNFYFIISPSNRIVQFPANPSPVVQNFCVRPNGYHPDLEVVLMPLIPARPGFGAKYKLIYKNKGNIVQSGTINLAFNDAVLDLVYANPIVSSQTTNNLSWNFSNLQPFETREITIILSVNSTIATPAVNSGDILNYTATITSALIDDMPNDNTFVFNQTVVNSFDPNDKTCLEGATISTAKVGDYVHYMIRFENNGTANAHNIVVKDLINTIKFDVNTLVPINGSHSFSTRITSGYIVEFIFENINLPFDDANNDGYVAFKIKTKSTLVLGDTFSNTASIYFDYNAPIVTNTATTTITALNVQDFEFSDYFNVYPNPVHDVLNISTKQNIEVSSVNIYNMLGQLVLVIPNAKNIKTVDVSGLKTGNYFIKINSDKGTSNTKFIKS